MELIQMMNKDESIHGILVNLPLPGHLTVHLNEILESISKEKDVDCVNIDNYQSMLVRHTLKI